MKTYFKQGDKLRRVDVRTDSIGTAQVEAYLAACAHKMTPTTTVLCVIDPDDKVQA